MEAVAIHGGKDQEERQRATDAYKVRQKDALVATDVASKVGWGGYACPKWRPRCVADSYLQDIAPLQEAGAIRVISPHHTQPAARCFF